MRGNSEHTPARRPTRSSCLVERPAQLRWLGRPDTAALLITRTHDRASRIRRALVAGLACWGGAIIALFLPGLHFVLVPLLLIGGPALAFIRLAERVQVVGVRGHCPACDAAIDERIQGSLVTVMSLRCETCHRAIELHAAP